MNQEVQLITIGNYYITLEGKTLKVSLIDNISTLAIIPSSGNSIHIKSLSPKTIKK